MRTIILLVCLLPATGWAQPTGWKVDTYEVSFEITNAGIAVDGSLAGLRYQLAFSPDALPQSNLLATVDVKTIDTGIGSRDDHLRGEDYFDAEKYPRIKMESQSFRKTGAGEFVGTFSLTIRDVTRSIEVPFTFSQTGDTAQLSGAFTIDRLDYGVGGSSYIMGDEVDVTIVMNLEAK